MLSFKRDKTKQIECQRLMTKIMNVNNPQLAALREGPRGETRMDLTMVVLLAPANERGRPDFDRVVSTVTKEISTSGMAVVLHEPLEAQEVFLAFSLEGEMKYALADVKHQRNFGGGLLHLGLRLTELINARDYIGLEQLRV